MITVFELKCGANRRIVSVIFTHGLTMMAMLLQMATNRYCSLLMLSAINCGLVFAPDASTDKTGRPTSDTIDHIDALQGTHID